MTAEHSTSSERPTLEPQAEISSATLAVSSGACAEAPTLTSRKNEAINKTITIDEWPPLPTGAEYIIRNLAAEEIMKAMLDNKLGHPKKLEATALLDLAKRFPGTCLRKYTLSWEDGTTRELLPLAMICCMRPPLWLVEHIYQANPKAISTRESRRGSLPIHYACAFEASIEVVRFLHSKYPEGVSSPRLDDVYPLHLACGYYCGRPEVVNFLIDQFPDGASKRCTDLFWFPLHSAAQGGAPATVLERLYNLYNESIVGRDKYGKTPLHTACRAKGNPENVQFLVRVGPEALQMEDYGHFKPIFLASMYQTAEVISILLDHTNERRDNLGATLLHWAAVRNTPNVVEFLATRFPNMLTTRTRDHDRYTPLLGACLNQGSVESIRVLIRHNRSTLTMADGDGRLPLEAAQQAGASPEVLRMLETDN